MKYETYKFIIRHGEKFSSNSADGTTTDQTGDASVNKDPNAFLAPLASGQGLYSVVIFLAAFVVLVYVSILLAKELKFKLPSV